ncbi:fungal chitosanase of glycosyl hydrolase group 75-domain-containing protein [Aspergillus karnatakaensis]|uniref:glycoside hydrolase family 75 protein n=1 Tax=Aspergillus karnatakaensis TaxID=1810916 RepID=UPI003CCD596E
MSPNTNTNLRRLSALTLCASAASQTSKGTEFNKPHAGPPARYFQAASTVPVAALQASTEGLSKVPDRATYPIRPGSKVTSTIYSDWAGFDEGAAIVWTADMDVDCDGIDHTCTGNPDGLPTTNWGALAAYAVPFIVIPDHYLQANEKSIPGNNIAAVICNNKMFYGILGDSNGDEPQVTGEASWLMARTCFPDEGLSGNVGHDQKDVTYILFLGDNAVLPDTAMTKNYITDFGKLRSMGDDLVHKLVGNLGQLGNGSHGHGHDHGNDRAEEDEDTGAGVKALPSIATVLGLALVSVLMGCV